MPSVQVSEQLCIFTYYTAFHCVFCDTVKNRCISQFYVKLFRSKDEDINLVSVDEFYEEAPKDISKPVSCVLRNSYLCVHTARHQQTQTDRDTDKLTQNRVEICVSVNFCTG